jgi:hypothetical protein
MLSDRGGAKDHDHHHHYYYYYYCYYYYYYYSYLRDQTERIFAWW